MNSNEPPVADEHLVAYLDGELEPSSREALERQLASDERLRQRLAQFEQSWNLLDSIPTAPVGDQFAQTTVSLAASQLSHQARGPARWRTWACAVIVGFLVLGIPLHLVRQQRLRDLPVIQNLELYRVAESVEFLQMLEDEGLFLEDVDDVL